MPSGLPVTLIHPGVPPVDVFERLGRSNLPPLGILYLAAGLDRAGHHVQVVDLNLAGSESDLIHRLLHQQPAVIGMGTVAHTLGRTLALARRLREVKADRTLLVAGGADATIRTARYVESGLFDAVLVGEADHTMLQLVESWPEVPSLDGIIGRGQTRTRRPAWVAPDDVPFPARHLVPIKAYRGGPAYKKRRYSTSIFTHRGCPYSCTFCEQSVHEGPVRFRSAGSVLEEVRQIQRDHGIRDIRFIDDVFMANRKVLHEFLDLVLESDEQFSWLCTGRVDLADDEMLIKMQRAGCYRIEYGIESGSDRILEMVCKGLDTDMALRAMAATRRAGIESIANFVMGFPTETEAEIEQTIDLALRSDADFAIFFPFSPFEGAEICEQFDLGWDPSQPASRAPSPAYVVETERLMELVDEAYGRFYFRPGTVVRRVASIPSRWVLWDLARMGTFHAGKWALRS